MKDVRLDLDHFLDKFAQLGKPIKMGHMVSENTEKRSKEDYEIEVRELIKGLDAKLGDRRKSNQNILLGAIIAIVALFIMACAIGYYCINSGDFFNIILAIICTFFPFLGNIKWLGTKWKKEAMLRLILETIPEMDPLDAVKFIHAFNRTELMRE